MSYYSERMQELGITPEINQVMLWRNANTKDDKGNITSVAELQPVPVFKQHDRGLEIVVYTIDRETVRIEKEGSRFKKDWSIIRLEHPVVKANGDTIKYQMPKGQGSFPFFPPALLDKYDNKIPIQTLFLTEGYIKAFVAAMHGVDIVGLPSITHLKNKQKGSLHEDVLKLIQTCDVKRVVWLTDGDCLDLSSKLSNPNEKVDVYRRPASFFASISTFKQLLDDYDVDKYFMHPDVDAIITEYKKERSEVKGIDDILLTFSKQLLGAQEIIADMYSVSKNGFWFQKFNITFGLAKVRDHFRLNNVNTFYLFHAERGEPIKGREFVFNGTSYKYNEEKGECEIVIPGDAQNYFRVGDDYYKFIQKPNKYKTLERTFAGRRKGTITDDHGKKFIEHIPKYELFCNVPEHINFQQVINNCFNVYNPLDYLPEEDECGEEDCLTILGFMKHIFGESKASFMHPISREKKEVSNYELGLDYIQILFQRPWEKLPILCLVSRENNTGKSTFGKLLKQIFGGNCAIVGNQDLAGDFNAHWSTKMIVICDETKIDKQTVVEKVKSLSTADKIMMNAKGKDHVEIDCFIKFVFITNNDENFIYVTDEDIRYWVLKVPTLRQENPTIMDSMIEEIPAFLAYLNRRKLATEKLNRMWFHPALLKTEALKKVQRNSLPTIIKELSYFIGEKFLDFDLDELYMTIDNIRREFFNNRYEANYLRHVLQEHFKVEPYHVFKFENKEYSTVFDALAAASKKHNELEAGTHIEKIMKPKRYSYPKWEYDATKKENIRVDINCPPGRPYAFKREQFVSSELKIERNPENEHLNNMTVQPADRIPEPQDDELPFPLK